MKIFASLLALAAFCPLFGAMDEVRAWEGETASGGMFTEINITRIKNVLRLTPAQQSYWPPVEAALRDIARQQSAVEGGIIRRVSHRVVSIALTSTAVARLGAAARPLIGVLDPQQRNAAISLAQEMGLGPVLASLQ